MHCIIGPVEHAPRTGASAHAFLLLSLLFPCLEGLSAWYSLCSRTCMASLCLPSIYCCLLSSAGVLAHKGSGLIVCTLRLPGATVWWPPLPRAGYVVRIQWATCRANFSPILLPDSKHFMGKSCFPCLAVVEETDLKLQPPSCSQA